MIDATRIAPRLYQGGAPHTGRVLAATGIHVLVLCAEEIQPAAACFPGVKVIHAPNDDSGSPPTVAQLQDAIAAAAEVETWWRWGCRVLVTCAQGRNRSGLVTALVLRGLSGRPSRECIAHIQQRRAGALTNPHFCRFLEALL